jgi:hypothetical protein
MRLLGQFDRQFTQFQQSYYIFNFVQVVYTNKKPRLLSGVLYDLGAD